MQYPASVDQLRINRARILHAPLPALHGITRLHLFAIHIADLQLREEKRLDPLIALIQSLGLDQHAGIEVSPQLVAVTHAVFRLQRDHLAIEAGNALHLAFAYGVIVGELADLVGQYCGEAAVAVLPLDLHGHRLG